MLDQVDLGFQQMPGFRKCNLASLLMSLWLVSTLGWTSHLISDEYFPLSYSCEMFFSWLEAVKRFSVPQKGFYYRSPFFFSLETQAFYVVELTSAYLIIFHKNVPRYWLNHCWQIYSCAHAPCKNVMQFLWGQMLEQSTTEDSCVFKWTSLL